ncbi:MAG: sulfate ABC transporter ATP-binding protein [Clostridiales bacterium]|nr:sulfate ABC transporter ATP-binding protein [Clostridiales bacterium]
MYIELKHINKTFGNFKASDDVSFGIEKGKLVALLGPSGSGKTTILRMIAGLEHQDDGDICIDGKCVNRVPVREREIGFVFQNYALFPYLTVYDNIAYGLKARKKDKAAVRERVTELLELVGLPGLEKRYPSQLSGGQKQRVAFARALAPQPHVLLLDEPFAAIDAKVRKELRSWLKEMIGKIGITSIFVTHDQDEAVEVADEIIVTNLGRVEQVGKPTDIYKHPQTLFVAQFIGESTLLTDYDRIKGFDIYNGKRTAIIRPEFVKVIKYGSVKQYESLYAEGVVEQISFGGNCMELLVNVNGIRIKARQSLEEEPFEKGEKVEVIVYRLYVVDENEAHLLQNKGMQEQGMFYI